MMPKEKKEKILKAKKNVSTEKGTPKKSVEM